MTTAIPQPAMNIQLRLLTADDQALVWDALRVAAHEEDDVRNMPLCQPYGQQFGTKEHDLGVGAFSSQGQPLGAAWIRDLGEQGFCRQGHTYPELAMAVFEPYQGQGIGTRLLSCLLEHAQRQSHCLGICLSCRTNNEAALHLYRSVGFVEVPGSEQPNRAGGTSIDMVCQFRQD